MSIVLELGDVEQDARLAAAAGMDLLSFMREAVRAKLRENNFAVASRPPCAPMTISSKTFGAISRRSFGTASPNCGKNRRTMWQRMRSGKS